MYKCHRHECQCCSAPIGFQNFPQVREELLSIFLSQIFAILISVSSVKSNLRSGALLPIPHWHRDVDAREIMVFLTCCCWYLFQEFKVTEIELMPNSHKRCYSRQSCPRTYHLPTTAEKTSRFSRLLSLPLLAVSSIFVRHLLSSES